MTRLPAVLLSAVLAVSPGLSFQAPSPSPAPSGDLEKGIQLARDGDFEGAVVELDAAVRALRELPARKDDLVRGLVYLATAYLQLDQELSARARLREAITLDPKLELSPREFSPQLLRVFEAVRADAGLPAASPAPNPSPIAFPSPRVPRPSPSPSPAKRRGAALWIVGGGVAAAGAAVAVAAGGGGGATATTSTTQPTGGVTTTTTAAPSTTTTTTTTAPGPAPTTTTTTTVPPRTCTYSLTPASQPIPLAGTARAECNVRPSDSDCTFTFQKDVDWIHFLSSTTGRGNGRMEYSVDPLLLGSRTGRITVAEGGGACTVNQSGALVRRAGILDWTSTLDAPGGRGQVVLAGAVTFVERGRSARATALEAGVHRMEANVVSAAGRPGTWTFALGGRYVPGSLRVLAGQPTRATDNQVTFALSGRPGERIAFTFRTDE
jgi:hypothetical protein